MDDRDETVASVSHIGASGDKANVSLFAKRPNGLRQLILPSTYDGDSSEDEEVHVRSRCTDGELGSFCMDDEDMGGDLVPGRFVEKKVNDPYGRCRPLREALSPLSP